MPADAPATIPARQTAPPGAIKAFFRDFSENRAAVVGLILLTLLILIAIFADFLAPYGSSETVS